MIVCVCLCVCVCTAVCVCMHVCGWVGVRVFVFVGYVPVDVKCKEYNIMFMYYF